jgi:hypothetical protein
MDHYISNCALDICLTISKYAYSQFTGLKASLSLHEVSESSASMNLKLFIPKYRQTFAKVEVGLHRYRLEKECLTIEVFAEIDLSESEGIASFKDEDVYSIFNKYKDLNPVVTEGVTHFSDIFSKSENPTRKTNRKLTIRYGIHDEEYEADDEYYDFDYDEEQIAKSTLPYLKSLQDIQNRFLHEYKYE